MVGTDVRDVLDEGSRAMTENLRVRCHSQRLADEARDLLLTYRSHHLCEISGGTSEDADGIVKLRYLLRSAPGDALCDGCLASASAVSLTAMRLWTTALLRAEPYQFQQAPSCASCRRVVPSIIYKPQQKGWPRVA